MTTAQQSKAAADSVSAEAVRVTQRLASSLDGGTVAVRTVLLEAVPQITTYYGTATATLAADFYEEQRSLVQADAYSAQTVLQDRTVNVRRGTAWALSAIDWDTALARLSEVVQPETIRPYRDTILGNRRQDPACIGWARVTTGGCGFCLMLAAKGAVYKQSTARFAAHSHCRCTAQPVFIGGDVGPEASTLQYMASKRSRTEAEKQQIREWVAYYEGR